MRRKPTKNNNKQNGSKKMQDTEQLHQIEQLKTTVRYLIYGFDILLWGLTALSLINIIRPKSQIMTFIAIWITTAFLTIITIKMKRKAKKEKKGVK